ncbi:alpha/beta hydrolase [Roseitranquillus sediminis]|uniref:alpha/beta hydrolase n=1 Tax=Roseitranquillus sediminis TaxID=2809051 RepID=UPI001D0C17E2|nr:alpha/beta hydrolase [Roseitranquillus sediminis]MBM9594857.1 alpha/beta fold hydrolase [Roseitranquillus sediminis]
MQNDDAYANATYIPGAETYPPAWSAAAEAYRSRSRARLGLPYGDGEPERLDLFLPQHRPAGLVVFVHGGYWRAFGRERWSHLAAGPVERGWAVAVPSYTLAPQARISEITRQIARAVDAAAAEVAGPVRLTGHSAGGHLVARLLCDDVPLAAARRLEMCLPISPLADLRPLIATSMNIDLRLDPREAAAESPALQPKARDVPVTVWVGAAERPAFLDQARLLAEAWQAPLVVEPGRHHFDVIASLAEADGELTRCLLG